jgi:hypothetical protein
MRFQHMTLAEPHLAPFTSLAGQLEHESQHALRDVLYLNLSILDFTVPASFVYYFMTSFI